MQAYHIEQGGEIDGIVLREQDRPEPGPGEVVVRVRAMSLNRRDLSIVRGIYPLPARPDVIPLSDGAGEIVAVGSGVRRFALGDRVASTYFPRWRDGRLDADVVDQPGCTLDGLLAEYAAFDEQALVRIPPHLSFAEAATLPCAALTAWSAVTEGRPVLPGETVLTLGTGGVALFALQFAKAGGARVIATTSSEAKAGRLRALGADEVVNYRAMPDWDRAVRALTAGRGVDKIVETGGADTLERSLRVGAYGSEIALVTAVGLRRTTVEIDGPLLAGSLVTLRRLFVGSRAAFEAMNRALDLHRIRPVIDRAFAFSEAKEAYRYFAEGTHMGKVVIAGA